MRAAFSGIFVNGSFEGLMLYKKKDVNFSVQLI